MDKRISYHVCLDCETSNGLASEGGQPLVYDIGWVITDKRGKIYLSRSYVIQEIFYGLPEAMNSAYYKNKLPQYREDIKQGKRQVISILQARKILANDCKEWNAKSILGHNLRFDYDALNDTIRYVTKSNVRFFFPYGVELKDTLKFSRQVIVKQKSYKTYCEKHGFLTKNGRPRATAEILYRYISGDVDFDESHTGLEDTIIEAKIYAHCVRQHKKSDARLFTKPKREPIPECLIWVKQKHNMIEPAPIGAG